MSKLIKKVIKDPIGASLAPHKLLKKDKKKPATLPEGFSIPTNEELAGVPGGGRDVRRRARGVASSILGDSGKLG